VCFSQSFVSVASKTLKKPCQIFFIQAWMTKMQRSMDKIEAFFGFQKILTDAAGRH